MLFGHAEGFTPLTIQLVICALILAAMFFAFYKLLQNRWPAFKKTVKKYPKLFGLLFFTGWGIFAWQIWQSFTKIGNKEEFEKTDPVKAIRFFSQQDTIITILAILLIVSIAMSLYFIIKDRGNLSVKENVLKNSWSGVIGVLVFVPLIVAVSINPAFFAAGAAIALALGAICFAIYKYYRKQALKKQIADFSQDLKERIKDSEKQIDFTIQNTLSDIGLTNNQAFMIENNLGARQKVTIFDSKDSSLQIKDGDIKHGLLCILQIYKAAGMKYVKSNQNTLNSEDEDANGGNFDLDLAECAIKYDGKTKEVLIEELCEKAFGDKHYITKLLQQTRLMCQAVPNGRFESAMSLLTNADNEHLLNNNIYANLHTISLVSSLADAILSGNKEYSYSLNDLFEPYYNADAATKAQKDNSSLIDKVFGSKITRYNITIIKVLFVASLAIGGASIMGFLPSEVGWTCLALLIFCLLAIIAMSFYRLATTNEAKVATTKAFYDITTKIKETDFQDLNIAKFDNIVKDAVEEAKKEQKERDKEERQEISGEDDDEDDEDEDNKSKKNSKSHNHASKAYIDSTSNNLSGEVVKIPKVGNKNSRNIDNIDTDVDSEEEDEESGSDEDNNNSDSDSDQRNKAKDDEINSTNDRDRFYKEQEEVKRKEQEQDHQKLISDALNKQYQAKIAAKISGDLQQAEQNVNFNILQSNFNPDKEFKSFAQHEGGDKGYNSAFGGLASFMQENSDGIRQSLALSKNLMDETAIEKAAKKEIVDSAVHVAGHKSDHQVDLLDDAEEIISDLNDKLQKVDGLNIEEQEILQNAMEILELLSPDNPLFKDLAKSINDAIAEKFGDKTTSLARQNDTDKPSSRLLG